MKVARVIETGRTEHRGAVEREAAAGRALRLVPPSQEALYERLDRRRRRAQIAARHALEAARDTGC